MQIQLSQELNNMWKKGRRIYSQILCPFLPQQRRLIVGRVTQHSMLY